jgi:L-amino acid N-acyltransferase YncA
VSYASDLPLRFFKDTAFSLGFHDQYLARVIISGTMSTATMRPELQIRHAREHDAPSLSEIFNEAVQDGLETFEPEPRTVEDQRLMIAAAAQGLKHPILVADVRNWIAGWVALAPYDTRVSLDDIGEVFIYVRRSFRSYGVGRQLMRAIQEAAGKLGYRKLIGRTLAENRDGLLLCRATGWREVGRHSAHVRLRDGLHDVMLLEYVIPVQPVPHA